MTEEQNVKVSEEKCNCICHSKGFRKFLIVALGSFVGVFCALTLFAALHKPPMPPCCRGYYPMMRPPIHQQNPFMRNERIKMKKALIRQKMDKKFQQKFDEQVEK